MKIYVFILLTGFIFGIFVGSFFTCNKPAPCPEIVKVDTVRITLPAQTSDWHNAPVAKSEVRSQKPEDGSRKTEVGSRKTEVGSQKTDPDINRDGSQQVDLVDSSAWWPEQWISRRYQETYVLPSGKATVESVVGQNKLLQQRVTLDSLQQTIITKTVQVPEKRKNQVFLGFNIQGSPTQLLTGAGPSVLWKTKSDKMLELGALYTPSGFIYQAGVKLKISLKK